MARIFVQRLDPATYEVTVEARATTTHTVTVDSDYVRQLTGGGVPTEALIERSFEFLLEREPNTSILRRFDLKVIGDYFAEYEAAMRTKSNSQ